MISKLWGSEFILEETIFKMLFLVCLISDPVLITDLQFMKFNLFFRHHWLRTKICNYHFFGQLWQVSISDNHIYNIVSYLFFRSCFMYFHLEKDFHHRYSDIICSSHIKFILSFKIMLQFFFLIYFSWLTMPKKSTGSRKQKAVASCLLK